VLAIALVAVACGDPVVPNAVSTNAELVAATAVPLPPTPVPTPTVAVPTAEPTPGSGLPVATPAPVRQPGLSSEVIRLAVIFDDETAGVADQLFRDAWLGATAWEHEVNQNGGLGGREVQVIPVDARLFDHRSVLEQVCEGDFFAILGSHSLGDFEGAEILGTEQCNMADFAGQVYGSRRAASPVTFLANPFLNDARQAGPARYLAELFPDAAENLALFYYFDLDLRNATERQREMLTAEGLTVVFEGNVDLEDDPTEEGTVLRWEERGAESLVWTADPGRLIELLEALEEVEQPPTFVLCEWGCYSQQFLIDGGDAVEGVYTWIDHSPFDSPGARGELFSYRSNLGDIAPDAGWSDIGLQSWMSGRLFEAAFNILIQTEPEAPTREQLIDIARNINFFTANGVLSGTNPGAGEPDPCFVLMVVQEGRWVQEYPAPPRDKDCAQSNIHELVTSRALGLTTISAASSSEQESAAEDPQSDLENPEDIDE